MVEYAMIENRMAVPLYGLLSNSIEVNAIVLNITEEIVMLLLTYITLRFFAVRYNLKTNEKSRYDVTREFRRDFKNHLIVLSGLIENLKIEKAKSYLKRFDQISQEMTFPVSTGNTAVDVFLGEKSAYAKKLDIHVKLDIAIHPAVKIDDFDLCAVFLNALDNAIKTCKSVNGKDKMIDITAKQNKDFFIIDIINTYEQGHVLKGKGIGLSVIKMIVEKYCGAVETAEEGNFFRISMILPVGICKNFNDSI